MRSMGIFWGGLSTEMSETTADNAKNPSVIVNLANTLSHEGFASFLAKVGDNKENMSVEPFKWPLNLNFSLDLVERVYFNRFMEN